LPLEGLELVALKLCGLPGKFWETQQAIQGRKSISSMDLDTSGPECWPVVTIVFRINYTTRSGPLHPSGCTRLASYCTLNGYYTL